MAKKVEIIVMGILFISILLGVIYIQYLSNKLDIEQEETKKYEQFNKDKEKVEKVDRLIIDRLKKFEYEKDKIEKEVEKEIIQNEEGNYNFTASDNNSN